MHLGHELIARVVAIGLHGEGGERHEVYAVAVFERCEVGVAQRQANDVADASLVACQRSHPQHVVVAPLNVPTVVTGKGVHDDVGSLTTVVDVAEDVELVNGELLYDVADRYNEIVGPSGRDNGVDDAVDVGCLVGIVGGLVKQLLYDVAEIDG